VRAGFSSASAEKGRTRSLQRLSGYDYSKPGAYFVTINAHQTFIRSDLFGKIEQGRVTLSDYGAIVEKQWLWLGSHFPGIRLDEHVVMPDHFHGIVHLLELPGDAPRKPLPQLMGAFKTTSSKEIHLAGLASFRWHQSYYDHIIRNEEDLCRIRAYIRANPEKWDAAMARSYGTAIAHGTARSYGTVAYGTVATVPYDDDDDDGLPCAEGLQP